MEKVTGKPSDYDLRTDFVGSGFNHSQSETIARNIMLLLKNTGDRFRPFTWKEYKKYCTHNVTDSELSVIEALASGGQKVTFADLSRDYINGFKLEKDGDTYSVNNYFLKCIEEVIKK